MRRGRLPALAALLIAALLVALAIAPPGDLVVHVSATRRQPPGPLPWLSVAGSRFVDSSGRAVLLHGFDSDALIEYSDGFRDPLYESDAQLMQASGFDVVRLGISWSLLEPSRGRFDTGYLDRVERTVRMLNSHRLYVVLDMHFQPAFSPRFGGAGAPKWAHIPNVPGFESSSNYWLREVLTPDAAAAFTYLFVSPDWQADFMMVWRRVANRFRDNPGVAGYDLFNEPHPFPVPPIYFEKYWLWPFYGRVMDAIGGVDANHIFFVDNSMFSNLPTTTERVRGAEVAYAPHVYYGVFGWPTSTSGATSVPDYIRGLAHESQRIPAPMWIGETSIDSSYPNASLWLKNSLDAYDRLGVGWAWWQWKEDSRWGVRSTSGKVDYAQLRALARPYLAAAPDDVTLVGDSSANHLEFTAAADHPQAPVDVAWATNLMASPRVDATCGVEWHWLAQAARVEIKLEPHVPCTVTVRGST